MDKENFTKLVGELFIYFNAKMPNANQIDMWFQDVAHVQTNSIPEIKRSICHLYDSTPKNIPKAILDAYQKQPTIGRPVVYDKTEDHRYPVQNMHKAFEILDKQGRAEFIRYCQNTHMPSNDQDRVLYKHRIIKAGRRPENEILQLVKNISQPVEMDEIPF